MYCPEGYLTLQEIYDAVGGSVDEAFFSPSADIKLSEATDQDNRYSQSQPSITPGILKQEFELVALLNWMMTSFFDCFSKEVRATTPAGIPVRISEYYLSWRDGDFAEALNDFYVQNGIDADSDSDFLFRFPDRLIERELLSRRRFPSISTIDGWVLINTSSGLREGGSAPLDGCPLCIAENALPCPPEKLAEWLIVEMGKREQGDYMSYDRSIPQKIVVAFATGQISKKEEARRLFGRGLKTSAWHATWKEAVLLEPQLSRPGPKS